MSVVTLASLTEGKLAGNGVFDKLMAACKEHLEDQFKTGAIKGADYAQVYLGSVQQVLQTSLAFLASSQKIDLEVQLLEAQLAQVQGQTALLEQQRLNAVQENKNLIAQECLLKAQFDNTQQTTLRVTKETDLMAQKIVTEKAQTLELGVDDNSLVGRQKQLYKAQTDGFQRDAEQKAFNAWAQTWSARRMTDEGTVADATNKLDDATGGRLMTKLLAGINA